MTDQSTAPPNTDTDTVIAENVPFEQFVVEYEGQRAEWHAGKVIHKMSNNERHQAILSFLHVLLSLYLSLRDNGKVYLDGYPMYVGDDKPARQPDLMIVQRHSYDRIQHQYLDGAADVVIEIISPGTGATDRGAKFYEYEAAGVQEYWIIDPERQSIDAYALNDADEPKYQRIKPADDETVTSQLLTGFRLNPAWLWQEELPQGQEIMQLAQEMAS